MAAEERTIGRYRIFERVGRGAMGVLYRGLDPVLEREVAIKVMSTDFDAEDNVEEARARFFREARAAARLQHRNIVTVFEFGEEAGVPYIVMEFLRGQSLAARLSSGPPLSLDQKLDIVSELCTGLQFAHDDGVVHRDVKPGNVWLLDDGAVKLVDFGVARLLSSTMTRQGDLLGSACYMAPEQVFGSAVDGRADTFSAAVVLYELLAGRRPFEGDSPTSTLHLIVREEPLPLESLAAGLPPTLVAIVNKGLQKNRDDRYQTAGDFAAELQLVRMSLSTADTALSPGVVWDETLYSPHSEPQPVFDHLLRPIDVAEPAEAAGEYRQAETARARDDLLARFRAAFEIVLSRRRYQAWLAGGVVIIVAVVGAVLWTSGRPDPARSVAPAARTSVAPPAKEPVTAVVSAPVEPPPAKPAVLKVSSEPAGAAIELDGRSTGQTTPAEVTVTDPPPQRIRITKKGFQSLEATLSPTDLDKGSLAYRLAVAEVPTVRVTIAGSYPFSVFDGDHVIGKVARSHELSVPSGHVIRLVASTYLLDYSIKVDATAGSTAQIRAPELGRLSVRSSMETCEVTANRQPLGFPPISARQVAAGKYRIKLKCPDGRDLPEILATVPPGDIPAIVKVS